MPEAVPYTILVLSPFHPVPAQGWRPRPLAVDQDNLPEVMEAMQARLLVPAPRDLCPEGSLAVAIASPGDLRPQGVVQACPYLKALADAAAFLGSAEGSRPDAAAEIRRRWPDLPESLLPHTSAGPAAPPASSAIDDILAMVATPTEQCAPTDSPFALKARIEKALADLLALVFADEAFIACESSWRGLTLLLRQAGIKENGPVRILAAPVSNESLSLVLDSLAEDCAAAPPGLVILDLPQDSSPVSLERMGWIASFAGSLLAPVCAWISPRFFHLDSWEALPRVQYLPHHLENAAFATWRTFAASEDAGWLVLAVNRFVGRAPYGAGNPARPVEFSEGSPLLLAPVWAFGVLAAKSVAVCGWPTRLTDYMNIRLENLPMHEGAAVETLLGEERIAQFAESGFTPLVAGRGKDAAFMPKAAAADGSPLKERLLLARVLGFLFGLHGSLAAGADLADEVRAALASLWRSAGCEPPEDLTVEAREGDLLAIGFTPSRELLPAPSRIEFSFGW